MTRITYLDNAATTAVRPEVLEAMMPFLSDNSYGNPSSSHRFGREARAAIEESKRKIANAVGARPSEVIFTSGGTEADNLAVIGGAIAARDLGGSFSAAVSSIEHKAVLAAAKALEKMGGRGELLSVDSAGRIDRNELADHLKRGIGIVSAMWVNNETGTIEDVHELAQMCCDAGVPFHTDAVQALGKLPCSMDGWPCTMMSISGHKIGAPKGIGALIVRDKKAVGALVHGGGQQLGIRPGTENVPGIVALGRAVELACDELEKTRDHMVGLQARFESNLRSAIPDMSVNGAAGDRAYHVSNVSIPGINSEAMLMHLDLAGIACSSGSACSTGAREPSHVLAGIGIPNELALTALRFSYGKSTTDDDIDYVVEKLPAITEQVRKLAVLLG